MGVTSNVPEIKSWPECLLRNNLNKAQVEDGHAPKRGRTDEV